MFFIANIEKVVRVEPYELGKNIFLKIRQKYYSSIIINFYRIE